MIIKKRIILAASFLVCTFTLSVSAASAPSEYSMPSNYYGETSAATVTPQVSASVNSAAPTGVADEIDSMAQAQGLNSDELDDYAKKLIEGRDLGDPTVALVGIGVYTGLNQEYDAAHHMYKQTTMYDTSFYSNIPNGSTVSNSVTLTFGEGQGFGQVKVTKDGKEYAYNPGDVIRESGRYAIYFDMQSAEVTSALFSNRAVFTFRIANTPVGDMDVYPVPIGYKISGVTYRVDSSVSVGSSFKHTNENFFIPAEDGIYNISMTGIDSNLKDMTMVLQWDTTPPEFELVGVDNGGTAKNKVSVKVISKDVDKVQLKLRGESVGYSGDITQPGNYVITVTDKAGNISNKNFTILYTINSGSVVSMLVLTAGAAGSGVFIVIRGRKNMRVR